MKKGSQVLILLIAFIFASCEKEEKPLVLPPKDDAVKMGSAIMGEHYTTQVFVNLSTGQQWAVDNNAWDIQFESSADGYLVTMNGGKGVLIGNCGTKVFKDIGSHNITMKWDRSSGMKDSLVLGNWANSQRKTYDSIFLIDRGISEPERFFQFRISSVDAYKYKLTVSDFDGNHIRLVTIPKDPTRQHVYFSFALGGKILNPEPPKEDWHLCFLRYRWVYYEFVPPLLYTVVGIHINNNLVRVAVDSTLKFSEIKKVSLSSMSFRDTRDVMGYDWKVPVFSGTTVKYVCRKYVN